MIIDPAARRAFAAFGTTDPTSTYSTSFGRATPSGVFKVHRLQNHYVVDDNGSGGDCHQLCEVATILDGGSGGTAEPLTWRRKSAPPLVIRFWNSKHKAVVNGVIYFIHEELYIDSDVNEDDHAAQNINRIVAFDLESEEWMTEAINGPALGHQKLGEQWFKILLSSLTEP